MFAQWRTTWADALNFSFWKDIFFTALANIKKLFFVVGALMLIGMGAIALSVPALIDQVMAVLDKVRVIGMIGHFLLAAAFQSALLVFVLQACAPNKNKDDFWHYLSRVFVFWLMTSVMFGFVGPYVPVALIDVAYIVAQFALFAWVYDNASFAGSFSTGFYMVVGSLPVLALLIGLSMALFATQGFILAMSAKITAWWGASFIIVTLYGLVRPALMIALYHKHKALYR